VLQGEDAEFGISSPLIATCLEEQSDERLLSECSKVIWASLFLVVADHK